MTTEERENVGIDGTEPGPYEPMPVQPTQPVTPVTPVTPVATGGGVQRYWIIGGLIALLVVIVLFAFN